MASASYFRKTHSWKRVLGALGQQILVRMDDVFQFKK